MEIKVLDWFLMNGETRAIFWIRMVFLKQEYLCAQTLFHQTLYDITKRYKWRMSLSTEIFSLKTSSLWSVVLLVNGVGSSSCGSQHDQSTCVKHAWATAEVWLDPNVTPLAVAVGWAGARTGSTTAWALLVGAGAIFTAAHDQSVAPGSRFFLSGVHD